LLVELLQELLGHPDVGPGDEDEVVGPSTPSAATRRLEQGCPREPGATELQEVPAAQRALSPNGAAPSATLCFPDTTMFEDDDSVFSAMRAGARGYVLKGADPSEILKVVNAVAEGEAHFGTEIARRLTDFFSAPRTASPAEPFPELTVREREVIDLIAQGHNNAEIARRLFVSPKTVRNHNSNIFTKLKVADRTQAILRTREAGLGRDDTL
jgi:DNA-binding NarL/FixJ family response regulator